MKSDQNKSIFSYILAPKVGAGWGHKSSRTSLRSHLLGLLLLLLEVVETVLRLHVRVAGALHKVTARLSLEERILWLLLVLSALIELGFTLSINLMAL